MAADRRGPRRRGAGTGLLVFLLIGVVIAGGLYALDRYAAGRVERQAAAQLQTELGTPTTPTVDVTGWPFLTQVVTQHLRSVHVVADDVGGGGASTVPVAHTDLVLTGVHSTDWFHTMTADHAEGTALVDYADLGAVSTAPLTYAGDGRLRVVQKTSFFGTDLEATVTGTPQLDVRDQTLTLADPQVSLGSVAIPQGTADALLQSIVRPIPVTGLPFGLTLSSVTAADDGLHVGVVGDHVPLQR